MSAIEGIEGASQLGIGRSRFHELYSAYLIACATGGSQERWDQPCSRGNRQPEWSEEVRALVRKLLLAAAGCCWLLLAAAG